MLSLAMTLCLLLQEKDDEAIKLAHSELDKTIGTFALREEKFTLGAARECLNQIQMAAEAFEKGERPREAAAIYDGAFERISKAIAAAEQKTSELRRIQGHLEKGRRRAKDLDTDEKKAGALRYALDRASMIVIGEINLAGELVNMSLRYSRGGNFEEALDALKEAEEKLPGLRGSTPELTPQAPRMASMVRARILSVQGKHKEGAAELRRGLELLPEFLEQDLDFKNLHAKPTDYDKHIKGLEAKSADDPDALLLLGYERYFSEHRDKSKATFDKILEKTPGDKAAKAFLDKLNE